ncbi:MAG: hypothetical protein V8T36_06150 [Ruthenibacterium lactatiformans]
MRYALGRTAKEAFKEAFFSFLQGVPDADAWAEDFWRTHECRFRPWHLGPKQPYDLVVLPHRNFCWRPPAAGPVIARPSPPV